VCLRVSTCCRIESNGKRGSDDKFVLTKKLEIFKYHNIFTKVISGWIHSTSQFGKECRSVCLLVYAADDGGRVETCSVTVVQ
jgi:hypothetical protein